MQISIISTSLQKKSESRRVSGILKNFILEIKSKVKCFELDTFEAQVPLWTSNKRKLDF